ncbi:MAG: hypothetical protein ACI8X5_003170 [Planctomycetota bacterium]|jgi:hypothetical protein
MQNQPSNQATRKCWALIFWGVLFTSVVPPIGATATNCPLSTLGLPVAPPSFNPSIARLGNTIPQSLTPAMPAP